jgi:hypothetical protein
MVLIFPVLSHKISDMIDSERKNYGKSSGSPEAAFQSHKQIKYGPFTNFAGKAALAHANSRRHYDSGSRFKRIKVGIDEW